MYETAIKSLAQKLGMLWAAIVFFFESGKTHHANSIPEVSVAEYEGAACCIHIAFEYSDNAMAVLGQLVEEVAKQCIGVCLAPVCIIVR
jgi:hypothetical protein